MELPETKNPIYREFFSKSNLKAKVEKTKWRGQPSENSFCFINPEVKYKEREGVVLNKLKEVFDIKFEPSDTFKKKFEMAISGDGQEVKRISTLHSSSLAALLLLYSVSKSKNLECTLDGNRYIFYDCFFEVKTNVKDTHFSNMDVVLIGENSNGGNVICFLESKFSEYFNTGMCNNISIDAYEQKYKELGLENEAIIGLHFEHGKGTDNQACLQIKSDHPHYCSGIKQMISHYMGVTNFIEKGIDAMDPKQKNTCFSKELNKLRNDGAEIILGEVLFAFDKTVDKADEKGETKLSRYSFIYEKLAEILNDKTSKLHVLRHILTYQDLLQGFELDKNIKAFYQL